MTEQKIEQILIDKIQSAINDDSIQVIGSWQSLEKIRKATEVIGKSGYVSIKTYPRQYETFTIPECTMQVDVTVCIRADVDYDGITYLEKSEQILNVLYRYQKSFTSYRDDFIIEDEFKPVGFRLDSGDCGIDKDKCLWTVTQSCTIMGIIHS